MKALGAYQPLNILDADSSYGQVHFTRVLGWSANEYEVLNVKLRTQLKDRSLQLYPDMYVFTPALERWSRSATVSSLLVLTPMTE